MDTCKEQFYFKLQTKVFPAWCERGMPIAAGIFAASFYLLIFHFFFFF